MERIYRDWIHGDDEQDSEYYFEKDEKFIRTFKGHSAAKSVHNTNVDDDRIVHKSPSDHPKDHPVSERPLFVKLTAAFHKRNGYTDNTPVGCHMMVTFDANGVATFSRLDAAGDSIVQANGYQFKGEESMD